MTSSTSCTKKRLVVETEKGKYTIPATDFVGGTCIAQQRCTRLGAILAPFTEKSEFDSVLKAIHACEHMHSHHSQYVGLFISSDNSSRVFSNGVKFSYELHGHLYQENHVTMPQNCPMAVLDRRRPTRLQINSNIFCRWAWRPYICFEPKKTAKSDAVISKVVSDKATFSINPFLVVALVCLIGYLIKQNKNLKLKLQQNSECIKEYSM